MALTIVETHTTQHCPPNYFVMGAKQSKVDPLEKAEELSRRVGKASNDRNRLTMISLNTAKLQAHSNTMHAFTKRLTKDTDKLVQQKARYTTELSVKQAAVTAKQKEVEDLKHAERLVVECQVALSTLHSQLRDLAVSSERGFELMKAQKKGQVGGASPTAEVQPTPLANATRRDHSKEPAGPEARAAIVLEEARTTDEPASEPMSEPNETRKERAPMSE